MYHLTFKYFSLGLFLTILNFCFAIGNKSFNVMAPLHVMHYYNSEIEEERDWAKFRNQLTECKNMGVDGVSVDVWWGYVEKENNSFSWKYYDKIFLEIKSKGLKIIPILSFHAFEPKKTSNFSSPIPKWIWTLINEESGIDISELKYNSEDLDEFGKPYTSNEFISHWANKWAMPQYAEFTKEFVSHFKSYLPLFHEINLSLDPSGELRYPSYNSHDDGKFPNRGRMQCYSKIAENNFNNWSKTNKNEFDSFSFIKCQDFKMMLESGNNIEDINLLNFFDWYNFSLLQHGRNMLKMALEIIPKNISIGFKLPGIHWRIKDPKFPRIAELTCGLINAYSKNGIKAYTNSLKTILHGLPTNRINFHFTCIEQKNPNSDAEFLKSYSVPEELTYDLSEAAKSLNLKIFGENSNSMNLKYDFSWEKMNALVKNGSYFGVTILRIEDVTGENLFAKKKFKKMIKAFKN